MTLEERLIAAGAKKIMKKRFFAECDKNGSISDFGVQETSFIDCKGNPTNPHVWVPPGKEYNFYNEATLSDIESKIQKKEMFVVKTDIIGVTK